MPIITLLLFFCSTVFGAEPPADWTKKNLDSLIALYKNLHEHPELSLHEEKTSATIAKEWRAAGLDVTTGVGGFGVVGVLKNGAGPTVLLRTDLDALPVTEKTGLDYA